MKNLRLFSAKIRYKTLELLKWRRYGHLGGSMSMIEALSVLYGKHLRHDPHRPDWKDRDYLVLSKGHSGPSLYVTLMLRGYFDEAMLRELNEGGGRLPSHPDRLRTPGIDATTGSLGQGTSLAAGLALSLQLSGKTDQYVYLIVGDGELNEGQCWEAFQFIAHRRLTRLIVLVDENKRQLDGFTADVLNPLRLEDKFASFGFHAERVPGADEEAIDSALTEAKARKDKPTCLILDTIKGQGLPFFEKLEKNHSVKFNEELDREADKALKTLDETIRRMEGGESR